LEIAPKFIKLRIPPFVEI